MDCKILTFLKLAAWDFVCIGVHTPHLCSLGTQRIQPEVHKSQRQQRQQWLWTLAHLLAFKRQEWKVWEKEKKMKLTCRALRTFQCTLWAFLSSERWGVTMQSPYSRLVSVEKLHSLYLKLRIREANNYYWIDFLITLTNLLGST